MWYEAGASKFDFADTQSLFFVQLILMGYMSNDISINLSPKELVFSHVIFCLHFRFVETKRYMDIKVPHSQGTEDSFFGLEPVLRGLEPGYEL